jgi:chromate reductase, NAD(P)H dehydrogenase (quinone)
MKVLAFAASNSSTSINRQLVRYAVSRLSSATVELLDINDYEMPIYSSDRESAGGIPQLAHDFKRKVAHADLVIISFAEHNGSYTAAYKNLFDWCSRMEGKVYEGKRMLLLATSPGARGAQSVLTTATTSMPHFGGEVLGSLSIPSFYDHFDVEKGVLREGEWDLALGKLLSLVG